MIYENPNPVRTDFPELSIEFEPGMIHEITTDDPIELGISDSGGQLEVIVSDVIKDRTPNADAAFTASELLWTAIYVCDSIGVPDTTGDVTVTTPMESYGPYNLGALYRIAGLTEVG